MRPAVLGFLGRWSSLCRKRNDACNRSSLADATRWPRALHALPAGATNIAAARSVFCAPACTTRGSNTLDHGYLPLAEPSKWETVHARFQSLRQRRCMDDAEEARCIREGIPPHLDARSEEHDRGSQCTQGHSERPISIDWRRTPAASLTFQLRSFLDEIDLGLRESLGGGK